MTSQTTAALKKAIRSVAHTDQSTVTDRDLIRRFVEDDDQAAFTQIVNRHGGMVHGVCRRMLANDHDAEDAVQATFLILSRKAKSVRWQASVANWLYTTARQVAHNAQAAARRRSRREAKAAVPESVSPVDRLTGRELLATLDAELDKLPPRYREPLVLCYLEGLTRDEAALRLGIPTATLKTRTERGRKKLHDALTKGGVALGAGLLALAATSPAGASPLRLVQAILATTSGTVPDAVAELAREVAVNGITKKTAVALTALIGVVALGIGVGSMLPQAAGQRPDKPPAIAKGDPEAPKPGTVTGRVLDPDGKPLAGAKLSLLAERDQTVDRGVTGSDGRFQVELPVGKKAYYLVARAEGVGLDFIDLLVRADPNREVEMRAVKDHPIRGRVFDTEGHPVAGATVSVSHVRSFAGDSLDPFLIEWKKRHFMQGLPDGVKGLWRGAGSPALATTDADGRFTVTGVGAERLVVLKVRRKGLAEVQLHVVNRPGFDPKPYNAWAIDNMQKGLEKFAPRFHLDGPELSVVAEAEKPIRGVVKEAETGKPRPGARVRLALDFKQILGTLVEATTDAEGRFEIRGTRKTASYLLEVAADATAGFLPGQAQVPDAPGYEPIIADISVKKGTIITGKVIDAMTKKALPGFARVGVLADNRFANHYPGLGSAAWHLNFDTGEDGTFRAVTIPGPVVLMGGPHDREQGGPAVDAVWFKYKPPVSDPNYPHYFKREHSRPSFATPGGAPATLQGNFCKVLEIEPGTDIVKQDIIVEPANALTVKVQDAAGQPLAGCWFTGISAEDFYPPIRIEKDTCTAYNLESGKPRLMVFHEPTKNLFGTLALKGDEKDEAVVKLGPGGNIKGRLTDDKGRPLAGVPVSPKHRDRTTEEMQTHVLKGRTVETDADGRFQIDGVVPGVKFSLTVGRGQKVFDPVEKLEDHAVTPGGTADLGDVKVKPKPGFNNE